MTNGATTAANPAASASTTNASNSSATPATATNSSLEFNPRWKGYAYILLASFINLMALSDIDTAAHGLAYGSWGVSLSFGAVMLTYSLAVLVTDGLQLGVNVFSYHKASEGRVEGISLLFVTFYSLVGVAYLTQVRGVAYLALNVYCSAWLLPVACVYTLNEWSTAHDVLSLDEITGVSATLKSWYIVALASAVVTGTSLNMLIVLGSLEDDPTIDVLNAASLLHRDNVRAAVFGTAFGCFSTVLAAWFILSHYNLVDCCWITEGGWVEMYCIIFSILVWIVGTAVLTQYGGLAATIIGSGAEQVQLQLPRPAQFQQQQQEPLPLPVPTLEEWLQHINSVTPSDASSTLSVECRVIVRNVTYSCDDVWPPNTTNIRFNESSSSSPSVAKKSSSSSDDPIRIIPGSNLFMAVWICLLATLNLASRWKAQQALQFAQAQHEKAFSRAAAASLRDDDDDEEERISRNARDEDDDSDGDMNQLDDYDDD